MNVLEGLDQFDRTIDLVLEKGPFHGPGREAIEILVRRGWRRQYGQGSLGLPRTRMLEYQTAARKVVGQIEASNRTGYSVLEACKIEKALPGPAAALAEALQRHLDGKPIIDN